MEFNTEVGEIETREYGIQSGYNYLGWYNGDIYSFYYNSSGDGANANIYLVKGSKPRSVERESNQIPQLLSLSSYPNPFNSTTTIKYSIAKGGRAVLKVFDLSGREVATLKDEVLNAGNYSATFNGEDMATGVYLVRLEAEGLTASYKMTLVK